MSVSSALSRRPAYAPADGVYRAHAAPIWRRLVAGTVDWVGVITCYLIVNIPLGMIGLPAAEAIPDLIRLLGDENQPTSVRTRAAYALWRMGPLARPAFPTIQAVQKSLEGRKLSEEQRALQSALEQALRPFPG